MASEITRTVRVMDGRNRQRFADDPQLLGEWISASTVLGVRRRSAGTDGSAATPVVPAAGSVGSSETPADDQARPAA
ncbi:MAG: hypothetical protein ACREOQ_06465 [Gemmatimonadales bacterium]